MKKEVPKKVVNPLFEKKARNFGIGKSNVSRVNDFNLLLFGFHRPRYSAKERFEPLRQMAQICSSTASASCPCSEVEGASTNQSIPSNIGSSDR